MANPATLVSGDSAHHHLGPALEIVIPVYNEEAGLTQSVRKLHAYLTEVFPFPSRMTIADNGSTDRTLEIARELAEALLGVRAVRIAGKGRGRALHQVWSTSDAQVLVYMDVDLSTDLAALLPLVAPLLSGHSDLAIGTRLSRAARVVRGPKREIISRSYNFLLRTVLRAGFSDAQCGFKAIRADRARMLLPLIKDTNWFFDTELLVLAERAGMRIHEVPVDWVDDPDSRVEIIRTAREDLKGVARLVRGLASGAIPIGAARAEVDSDRPAGPGSAPGFVAQVIRFGAIGVVSTLAYMIAYVLIRQMIPAQEANGLALLVTAVGNTAANRRFTFGIRSAGRAVRHHAQGLGVFAIALVLTTGSLAVLSALVADPPRMLELSVLGASNLLATVMRFVLLRTWVFRTHRHSPEGNAKTLQTQ